MLFMYFAYKSNLSMFEKYGKQDHSKDFTTAEPVNGDSQ